MVENRIIEDQRVIRCVIAGGDGDYWRIDGAANKGITKIVPYLENGQMAEVTWLAVYKGDVIVKRVNCATVESIEYVDETQDKEEFLRDCPTCQETGRGLTKRRINETTNP